MQRTVHRMKARKIRRAVRHVAQLLAAAGMLVGASSYAATVTWNVAGGGAWDTTSNNWIGGVPDPNKYVEGDAVIFNNTAGGTITLAANRAPTGTTISAASGTYTFTANTIAGGAANPLNKSGGGTAILQSNFTGGTITLTGGILALGAGSGDGINPTGAGGIVVDPGATLRFDASNRIQNAQIITLNGTGTLNRNGFSDVVGGLTGNGSVIGNNTLTLDNRTGVVSTFSGSITGSGVFEVRGNNVNGSGAKQILTGTLNTGGQNLNIRRGDTANDAVVLELAGSGSSTVGAVAIGLGGSGSATLNVKDTHTLNAANFSIGDQNSQPGTVNQSGGTINVTGVIRHGHWPNETSAYNLSGGALNLTGNPGATVNQGGVAEQNGVMYLGIDGTGNLTMTGGTASMTALVLDGRGNTGGTDTFILNAGKLSLGNGTNATTLANSGIFSGNFNNNTSYLINIGGGTLGANSNWSSNLNMVLTGVGGAATFDTDGRTIIIGGTPVMTNTGQLTGAGGLTKVDAGTLSLRNANNTYGGVTMVNAGTLSLVNATTMNNIALSPTIDVDAGAFLDVTGLQSSTLKLAPIQSLIGNGTIVGSVITDPGSTIAPGNSIGLLTFRNNLDIDGLLEIEIDKLAGTVDMIDVLGNLDITGATVDFSLVNATPVNETFVFAKYGSLTGTFADLNVLNLPDRYYINYAFQGNQIALVAMPEPASLMLLAFGGAALLRRRRR